LFGRQAVDDGNTIAIDNLAAKGSQGVSDAPGTHLAHPSCLVNDRYLVTGDLFRVDKDGVIELTEYLLTARTGAYRNA
jgi:hypothetical protein